MGRVSTGDAIKAILARKGSRRVGRTKLMKCLYFLQEECQLDTDLDFELYTWGPFEAKVLAELGALKDENEIIEEEPPFDKREKGYNYTLNESQSEGVLTSDQEAKLEALLAERADVLEAMSTLHFASKQLESDDRELVVERVKNIKPYFRLADLRRYWDKLIELDWL